MISSKALGLVFLFVTSAAWIGASFITQALVSKGEQAPAALEPWLLTLICSSTLMLYLPFGHCARKRARYEGRVSRAARSPKPRTRQRKGLTVGNFDDCALEHATTGCLLPRRRAAAAAAAALADGSAADGADEFSDEDGAEGADAEVGALGRGGATRSARGVERQPLLHPHPHKHSHPHQQHGGGSGEAAPVIAGGESDGAEGAGEDGDVETAQIIRAALVVAPVWFAAQLAFTASLEYTSVTSNTVLSSCSSLFVYLGSLALGQELSSALRFASVIAAMAGTTLVALGDRRNEAGSDGGGGGSNPLFGDALTLLAAALYAMYTLMMKKLLVKDDAAAMALFFGSIGVVYFAVLVPVVGVMAVAGAAVVRRVTSRALGLALVQGLIDYVAADYAWARAVMLLGPTATSCGLAMQIPAAGVIDAVLNGSRLSWSESPGSLAQFIVGSLLIICGFVGVSLEPRVLTVIWKRVTECAPGGSSIVAGGGSGHGSGGAAACPEAGADMMRLDGRPPTWGAAAAGDAGGGGSGEHHAVGGGLLGGELEARRGRRESAGGAGSGGGGGGAGVGKAGRGVVRGTGLGGRGAGSGSAGDLQSYIPLSSTAGPAASGRGAPGAGSQDM